MVSSLSSTKPVKEEKLRFDPDEIRRLVQQGKDRGLIRDGNTADPVAKDGEDAAQLAAVRSQWMEVGPTTAAKWLENNFRNRPISEDVVSAYARDMTQGVWIPTHQGIAFNDRDELIDGQHRLMAIVRSGVGIRIMVTFGLPSVVQGKEMTTMDAVDRGRTRSVADQLKIQHGLPNGSAIAAISVSIATICSSERTRRLSVGQTLEIWRSFELSIERVIDHRSKKPGLRSMGVAAGFAFAIAPEFDAPRAEHEILPWGKVSQMFADLNGDTPLRENSPLAHLRAFLTSEDAKLLNRSSDRALSELVLQAIHLELLGRSIEKLELSTEGADHFRALQPERVAKIATLFQLPAR